MVAFVRAQQSRLYVSDAPKTDPGWWGFLVGPSGIPPEQSILLGEALTSASASGSFIYSAVPPDASVIAEPADLINALDQLINKKAFGGRAIVWLASATPAQVTPTSGQVVALALSGGKIKTNNGIDVTLTGNPGVAASIAAGSVLTAPDNDTIQLDGGNNPAVTLSGPIGINQLNNTAILPFSGPMLGTLRFNLGISRRSLAQDFDWGFQMVAPQDSSSAAAADAEQVSLYITAFLRLADGDQPSPTDFLGFVAQINLVNPNNLIAQAAPTLLYFTGKNSGGSSEPRTRLVSYFRTTYGEIVSLYPLPGGDKPAALAINPGYRKTNIYQGYCFGPIGDFALAVEDAAPGDVHPLLCGLSGSESLSFRGMTSNTTGASLRFTGGQSAFAPQFPLVSVSPVGPPYDAAALLLTTDFRTSWATMIGPPLSVESPHYAAAPRGSDLFGQASPAGEEPNALLSPRDPGVSLASDNQLAFPMLPYAGFTSGSSVDMSASLLDLFERQITGTTRRKIITAAAPPTSPSAAHSLRLTSEPMNSNATTPAGFIANLDGGRYAWLLLAQVMDGNQITRQFGFTDLDDRLQAAFQTDNLFFVVANADHLGPSVNGVFSTTNPAGAHFYNTLNIQEWVFQANVGIGNKYGDYRNVLLVKGVRGSLVDLVKSPDKWTQANLFASPTGADGKPDVSQLLALSSWLSAYFRDALAKKDDPYFREFGRIAQDPNWQGVLVLRAEIRSIPVELRGVIAGVSDLSNFVAHHLGIEISRVDGATVTQDKSSSLFGLVDYVDPRYDDAIAPHPIAPSDPSAPYEFTLLTLKALFQSSAVQRFDSLAQMITNKLFGSTVLGMGDGGNVFNAILLAGTYQRDGTTATFSLTSRTPSAFLLANNVLTKVLIDTASMSTRDDGAKSGELVSFISMLGHMTFATIQADGLPNFDIFSFDALQFNGLGLEIAYPVADPSQSTLTLVESELSFNTLSGPSVARAGSLFPNFQLALQSLQSGSGKTTPQSLGYLTVATPYGLRGVDGSPWHGLAFKLNLGTPGALAGKINLGSTLLLAWSDDVGNGTAEAGYRAVVGMQLPGGGAGGELFSIQTVLKLSVGVLRLVYNADQKGFLLLMNEIAIKFFGLLKLPPNGSTSFFLFGNPNGTSPSGLGWYAIYNQDQPKS